MLLKHLCHHSKPVAADGTGILQVQMRLVTAHMLGILREVGNRRNIQKPRTEPNKCFVKGGMTQAKA